MVTPTTRDAQLVDTVLSASRALVAVAARSLAGVADDVTLPQYRVLVLLAAHGPQRPSELAAALGVDRSTATRMVDRLSRKHLVARRRSSSDRRTVRVALTGAGEALIVEVTRRRREEIERILARMPADAPAAAAEALAEFAAAAGEVPEQSWSLGWDLDR